MRQDPAPVTDATVLGLVRSAWGYGVDAVERLPVGSGTHHWRATARGGPVLFVTYDRLAPGHPARHTAASLEDAYAAAADLAFALDFVISSVPSSTGTHTLPVAGGALSVTPWVIGEDDPADAVVRILARLHAAHPPRRTPRWAPLVAPDLAETLARQLGRPGHGDPHGEAARADLRARLDDIDAWTGDYHRLTKEAEEHPWVPTHGAPHARNLLHTPIRTLLVDWSSLRLAPRERDLVALVDTGHGDRLTADPAMLHLFDLERRLGEVVRLADSCA